jgi:poly-gamma-glutamate capsule biosynthesis protein CapA/YwtB (metallophosphatase superfamily)
LRGTVLFLMLFAGLAFPGLILQAGSKGPGSTAVPETTTVRFLALGDINLGRRLGQKILSGDTLHPFTNVRGVFAAHDLVFGNLESAISDQRGETESPGSNIVFCAPPAAAWSLKRGGVDFVSIANNHALDYGEKGRRETMSYLRRAGVGFAGTSDEPSALAGPAFVERNGIRFAFFACTALMNQPGTGWKGRIAAADTGTLLPRIRAYRDSADVVVVSYHGGNEYADHPAEASVRFARNVIDAGADLFLGHHPHVPYGVERRGKGLIVHSLGNFVFVQPSRFWTVWSYGLSVEYIRGPAGVQRKAYAVLPVRCGFQPEFAYGTEADSVGRRILQRTTIGATEH